MESPYRQWENKVESFEGLPRKMQMLFFKKGSIFHYGYGHMIPPRIEGKEKFEGTRVVVKVVASKKNWKKKKRDFMNGISNPETL